MRINSCSLNKPYKSNLGSQFAPVHCSRKLQTFGNATLNCPKENKTKKDYKKFIFIPLALAAISATAIITKNINNKKIIDPYRKMLADGLSAKLGKKINPKALSCVMNEKEFLSAIKKLNRQNYIASKENVANFVFRADLHSHSNFSDGLGDVKSILNQVADYANKLKAKTGENFIFALSDHSELGGIEKALEIISQNPKAYKNISFVPAVEISFAHSVTNSTNPCEVSELLAYCVNPFSDNIKQFITNIKTKRKTMAQNFLSDIKTFMPDIDFSADEMNRYFSTGKTFLMNNQWRVHHYAQVKSGITQMARTQGKNPQELFYEIMKKNNSKVCTLYALKQQGLVDKYINEHDYITQLAKEKYSPYIKNGKVLALAENNFEEIIETFSKEKGTFLAFAHPAYVINKMHTMKEVIDFITSCVKNSKGLIKASESYHQAYRNNLVSQSDIENLRKTTQGLGMLNFGGRDSHNRVWLNMLI